MPRRSFANVISTLIVSILLFAIWPHSIAASTISLQPLRQEVELNPGESISNFIIVTNQSDEAVTVEVNTESFQVINESYDYEFTKLEAAEQWVSFDDKSMRVAPNKSTRFNYTLGVPANAEPGGKYIAVFASVRNSSQESISVVDRLGQLLYVTVKGEVSKKGEVLDIAHKSVKFSPQLAWALRLKNIGSTHFTSTVSSEVVNVFGRKVAQKEQQHLILPGTVRSLGGDVILGHWPGLYKIKFAISLGDDPGVSNSKWIIYLPSWSVLLALTVIAGVIVRKQIIEKNKRRDS